MIHYQEFLPLFDPTRKVKKVPLNKMKYIINKAYLKADKTQNFIIGITGPCHLRQTLKTFDHRSLMISIIPMIFLLE